MNAPGPQNATIEPVILGGGKTGYEVVIRGATCQCRLFATSAEAAERLKAAVIQDCHGWAFEMDATP